jgi:adhesin transport system outer membrane protein
LIRFLPAVAALLSATLFHSAANAETLAEAVARALAQFPEMRAAAANRDAVAETVAQARSAWLPTVDASLGRGTETSNNVSTRVLGSSQSVTLPRREAEINVSQLLFDGGNASGQVRRAEARAMSASEQFVGTAEATANRAAQAYVEVLRLRGLVQLAGDNVQRHEMTLELVGKLSDSGRGRRADSQQAEARLALAESALSQLRGQLVQAEAAYRHVVGQQPGVLVDPRELSLKLPPELEAALALVQDSHPAVRAAMRELDAAQANRESARARSRSPRLALELGASSNHDIDGIRGPSTDQFAMLRLRYNLFRGGGDAAQAREAEARVDEAMANLAKAKNDVERDLRLAWDNLREGRTRLPQLGRYVGASNEVVVSYRAQFSIGQRTMLDVLNAENELFNAKSGLYSGLSAVTSGELRVLSAMGRLLDALRISLPDFDRDTAAASSDMRQQTRP